VQRRKILSLFLFLLGSSWLPLANAQNPQIELPSYGINSQNLAVIVKRGDLLSEQTAEYYQQQRHIPIEHLYTVDLPDTDSMDSTQFKTVYRTLLQEMPDDIQGLLLTWQKPYRVESMSVTSAFSFGFDSKYTQPSGKGCQPTAKSSYFNSFSTQPWQDLGMRPSMLLTGRNFEDIKHLIDRGVASDGKMPVGSAYLVRTSDQARSTRASAFKALADHWNYNDELRVKYMDRSQKDVPDYLQGIKDIMLYQTGGVDIPFLNDNSYLPGAIADHLTSVGGAGLGVEGQMKAFRWLEAGATGSYGTVIEPCNFPAKFPNPIYILPHYLAGETLLESYWKSVEQPGEGLFVGEPLARPFGAQKLLYTDKTVLIKTRLLKALIPYQVFVWDKQGQKYKRIKAKVGVDRKTKSVVIQFNRVRDDISVDIRPDHYKIVDPTMEIVSH